MEIRGGSTLKIGFLSTVVFTTLRAVSDLFWTNFSIFNIFYDILRALLGLFQAFYIEF
jgi:hypothetical protein